MNESLTVHELLRSHYVPAHIDMERLSTNQLRCAANLLSRFLSRPCVLPDLCDSTLRAFMRWLLDNGRSPRTVNGKRAALITLWRFAFRKGMIPTLPSMEDVPKAKEPRRIPTSWTDEEFSLIVKGCGQYPDKDSAKILKAVVLTAWDTDCRIGAIMGCLRSSFSAARRSLLVYETKTKTEAVHYLSEPTCQAIQSLPLTTDRLFSMDTQDLRDRLTSVLKSCGLPATRKDKFHKIRRTKYTAVYRAFGPNAASAHAGHTTDMSKHYLDTRQLVVDDLTKSLPPPLAG